MVQKNKDSKPNCS